MIIICNIKLISTPIYNNYIDFEIIIINFENISKQRWRKAGKPRKVVGEGVEATVQEALRDTQSVVCREETEPSSLPATLS